MKKYKLCNSISDDFMYVYSPNCKSYKEFTIKDDCIKNSYNEELKDWDYISIVTKEKYTAETTIITKCLFKSFGAPLIVFTDDVFEGESERLTYGHHYEVVAYENGINVWSIVPWRENTARPIKATLIATAEFPVKADIIFELSVTIKKGKLIINLCDHILEATDNKIPESFYVGITACEGENEFAEFVIK